MAHLPEDLIAAHAAGLLLPDARTDAEAHLAACETCRSTLAAYQPMVAALASPRVRPEIVARLKEQVHQRMRLKRFIHRLVTDLPWRIEVQRDPRAALERHRIRPTPQLVAALREVSSLDEGVDGSQLDERISKLLPPM